MYRELTARIAQMPGVHSASFARETFFTGNAIGAAGVFAIAQVLRSTLFGVRSLDPGTLAAVCAV